MSQNTLDCPSLETYADTQASELARMRYDLIVKARREIRAGQYDDETSVDRMIEACAERIATDTASA